MLRKNLLSAVAILSIGLSTIAAQDASKSTTETRPESTEVPQKKSPKKASIAAPPKKLQLEQFRPLNRQKTVFVNSKLKRVVLAGHVVLRDGLLELFCCRVHSKEHESILAVDARASTIHSGLLLIGAKVGSPAQFTTKFIPPRGQALDIVVHWTDTNNRDQKMDARKWVRHCIYRYYGAALAKFPTEIELPKDSNLRYDKKNRELSWYGPMSETQKKNFIKLSADKAYRKAVTSFYEQSQIRTMTAQWVFAGSGFELDPETNKEFYLADESGELICVANFPSAMIDVAEISSTTGASLSYEANTEVIPPEGSAVWIELKQRVENDP